MESGEEGWVMKEEKKIIRENKDLGDRAEQGNEGDRELKPVYVA